MKKTWILTCALALALAPSLASAQDKTRKPTQTRGAPTKICKSTVPLKGALLKNAYPGHISKNDPRASGFAFVCGSDCARSFPVSAFFSDGTLAFKLGYYGRWEGNGQPRAYCGTNGAPSCPVGTVVRQSRQAGRDGKVYLHFGGGSCRSATPGVRNGNP